MKRKLKIDKDKDFLWLNGPCPTGKNKLKEKLREKGIEFSINFIEGKTTLEFIDIYWGWNSEKNHNKNRYLYRELQSYLNQTKEDLIAEDSSKITDLLLTRTRVNIELALTLIDDNPIKEEWASIIKIISCFNPNKELRMECKKFLNQRGFIYNRQSMESDIRNTISKLRSLYKQGVTLDHLKLIYFNGGT